MIYLVSTAAAIKEAGLPYVFTDGHAVVSMSDWFEDLRDLTQVDSPLMESTMWIDTPDRRGPKKAPAG